MFPRYDPNKKEIVGCKKNSIAYCHELRHKQQMDVKILYNIYGISSTITINLMLFFMLLWIIENDVIFISGMGLVSIPFVSLVMLLEIDAIVFGAKYWIDFKKGKRRSSTRTWKW